MHRPYPVFLVDRTNFLTTFMKQSLLLKHILLSYTHSTRSQCYACFDKFELFLRYRYRIVTERSHLYLFEIEKSLYSRDEELDVQCTMNR